MDTPLARIVDILDAIAALKLQNGPDSLPKRHQPLTLLWAIGRARAGQSRMTPWPVASQRIGQLIQEFGRKTDALNPHLPFLALDGTGLWELSARPPSKGHVGDPRLAWLNSTQPHVKGGLTEPVHNLVRTSEDATVTILDVILGTYFEDADPSTLLGALGLAELTGRLAWSTPIGSQLTREERMRRYGGAKYGGIEPSSYTPNVFVYSDPARGMRHGYNFDGWNEDRTVFLYTGDGRVGDQVMKDGNLAIYKHREQGRDLRLFVADGYANGSQAKLHRYLGKFELDEDYPYFLDEAPDDNKSLRTVFVFRLRPAGQVLRRAQDRSTTGDANSEGTSHLVQLEANIVTAFASSGSAPTTATRRESGLTSRYEAYLGRPLKRWSVRPPGSASDLKTDAFDEYTGMLYEAKGTTTRDAIRLGIGQLLDYRRHIQLPGLRIAMLLPHRPAEDLLDLLLELGIYCVYEEEVHSFVRVRPKIPWTKQDM